MLRSHPTSVSIRARIGVTIFAFSVAVLLVSGLAAYFAFANQLRASFDDTLISQAASNASLVDVSDGNVALAKSEADGTARRAQGETLTRLYDARLQRVSDSAPTLGVSLAEEAVVRSVLATGREELKTVRYGNGEEFRVLASPVSVDGGPGGVLVTGIEAAQVSDPLTQLRRVFLIATPLASILIAAGAFLIARNALRPVAVITATAERIASGDLSERIAGIASRDEVGQLATTFNRMLGRVAETVERERRFTSDAAHELRTPLAALEASIDVTLSAERSADEYRHTLEDARRQTARLARLARQLLVLSRLESGSFGPEFDSIDLRPFVEAVVASFADAQPAAAVQVSGAQSLPVRGDFELLTRAFGNILENAVVHGGTAVRINVTVASSGAEAVIRFSDDGPGIPDAVRSGIFQRFARGDASRGSGGTGLGLAIVDAIVRAHAGSISVKGAGPGATFEVRLPLSV